MLGISFCDLFLILDINECSAPDVGGGTNHPEALRRLIEMELRSNPKQIHPFAAAGYGQGSHELDMGFGYR